MTEHATRPIRRGGAGDDSAPHDDPPPAPDDGDLRFIRGARFGRFLVLSRLGAGGMGVVVSAFDPDLDRRVAIKVLHSSETRGAIVLEAKAMARLAHPNVVTVYEVEIVGDDVFLVMELVDGENLAAWMERRPPWREVVDVFVAAGRGLAAAHAAALVHRDFKPHNVLRGRDGRVRVTDFGVVGVAGAGEGAEVVLGTPAYMAPEQHRHEPLDPRADQWSFCVALFEALYHQRPFDGDTPDALRAAICDAPIAEPRDRGDVPARIDAIVRRGLAKDRDERWPSMDALLAELERDPWRPRRRAAATLGIAALAGIAVFGWTRGGSTPARSACEAAETQLVGVWDGAVRASARDAFVTARPLGGAAAFDRVATRLDAYAATWTEAYTEACDAPGGAAARGFHERLACLGELRDDVRELTAVFQRDVDGVVVDGAVAAVAALGEIDGCAARRGSDDPGADSDAVAALRRRLARAEALSRAGLLQPAVTTADEVARDADALGDPAVIAEAQLLLGLTKMRADDGLGAEPALIRATRAGAAAGHDLVVARAETALIWVVGHLRGHPERALAMQPLAEVAVMRAGDPARLRAELRLHLGSVLIELGRYDDAVVELERARAIWTEELDPRDPDAARPILNLGNVALYRGRIDDARAAYLEALAIREAALGSDHPDLVAPLGNLGAVAASSGDPASAITYCERALAITEAALGPHARARAHELRCLAEAARETGDPARARALLEEAVALDEDDPDGGSLYYALVDLGELTIDDGDPAGGLTLCNRAHALFDTDELRDHPDLALALTCRGRALLAIGGDGESARGPLERALSLREANGAAPRDLADTRFALARALYPSPRDRARARSLATAARDAYRATAAARLADADAWLAAHP